MRFVDRTSHALPNIKVVRQVVEGFDFDALVAIEDFAGADLLIVRSQGHAYGDSMMIGLRRDWLEKPGMESKLVVSTRQFCACVAQSLEERSEQEALVVAET